MTLQLLLKLRRRGLLVASNAVNSLLVPLLNPLLALLVIRLGSPELWGEFVAIWVGVQFGVHLVTWGNKEYLLRAFSRNPTQIAQAWQSSLITRAVLLGGLAIVLCVFAASPMQAAALLLWVLGLTVAQAHEVLVQYRRAFLFAAAVELGGIALLLGGVLVWRADLTLEQLLWLFALSSLGKAAVLLIRFRATSGLEGQGVPPTRRILGGLAGRFDYSYFGLALPFFLLGFSGLVQSRVDLYAASYFLPHDELARYQVLTTWLTYGQVPANLVLVPFVKTLYRLSPATIVKLTRRLALLGLGLVGPMLAVTALALHWLYQFDITLQVLLIGGLYLLPIYGYLPIIYALFKVDQSATVIAINGVGIVANGAVSIALLPHFGLVGALAASAVAQWLMLGAYLLRGSTIAAQSRLPLPDAVATVEP